MLKLIKRYLMLGAVVVMALLMGLIFFGTLAQRTHGIWWVMDQYFTSIYVWVPMEIFAPTGKTIGGSFPYPGGTTLGFAFLALLLVTHAITFKLKARGLRLVVGLGVLAVGTAIIIWFQSWGVIGPLKVALGVAGMLVVGLVAYTPGLIGTWLLFGRRAGIVLIHASLILLIVGETVTRMAALETQMPIYEGQTQHWTQDIREVELALIAPTADGSATERTIAFPQEMVEQASVTGRPLTHPELPFEVHIERYFTNSAFAGYPAGQGPLPGAVGMAQQVNLVPRPRATGVGGVMMDFPGAWVRVEHEGRPLARYAVSAFTTAIGDAHRTIRQSVPIGDDMWSIDLRFRRYYQAARFRLVEFSHDTYPGTDVPLNFASDIEILEPGQETGRHVHIRMNQPLRYGGQTFFQSQFIPDPRGGEDLGTVLQVVRNPGSTMPYIACALGGIGLLAHFVLSLWRFMGPTKPHRGPA